MKVYTITLDGVLPMSMNERERCSFWKRKNELDCIIAEVNHLAQKHRIPTATTRRAVTVTIHKSTRSRVRDDPANRDARAKSILDALVRTKLLIDDSDQWLDWNGVTEGDKRATKTTVITITDTET